MAVESVLGNTLPESFGRMEQVLLYDRPFTDVHFGGPEGIFSDE